MSPPSLSETAFAVRFQALLDEVADASSRSRGKFRPLESWLSEVAGVRAKATFLSSLRKQYAARVGQTLSALPELVVLLSPESWAKRQSSGELYVERLEALVRYATGLQAVVACVGQEHRWTVEYVVGRQGVPLRAYLGRALGPHVDRPVTPD